MSQSRFGFTHTRDVQGVPLTASEKVSTLCVEITAHPFVLSFSLSPFPSAIPERAALVLFNAEEISLSFTTRYESYDLLPRNIDLVVTRAWKFELVVVVVVGEMTSVRVGFIAV